MFNYPPSLFQKKKKEPNSHFDRAPPAALPAEPHFPELKSLMTSQPRPESTAFGPGGRPPHPTVCGKVLPDNAQLTDTKNEATSKFWNFVQPYVAEFVEEDLMVRFLNITSVTESKIQLLAL